MSENFNAALLARVTSDLPQGEPKQVFDAILDRPDAEAFIPAMPADALFRLIKEVGWEQGVDLIPYVEPEQLQVFVDIDIWRRERFLPVRMDPWMHAVVHDLEDRPFQQAMRELDGEVLALYFQDLLQVMDTDEEGRIPDHAPPGATMSPDGTHVLIYPEDETRAALARKLIARLYELDRALAWTLLEATRWELPTEMEEYALRWRHSRLEEYGFVSRLEALSIYKLLDPAGYRERLLATVSARLRGAVTREVLDTVLMVDDVKGCNECAMAARTAVRNNPGIRRVRIDISTGQIRITHLSDQVTPTVLQQSLEDQGHPNRVVSSGPHVEEEPASDADPSPPEAPAPDPADGAPVPSEVPGAEPETTGH